MDNLRRMASALWSVGLQSVVAAIGCWTLTLACAAPSQAQGRQTALKPQGVYARETGHPHFLADLRNHLKSVYHRVLNNSAVSGIAAGIHWRLLEPENGKYYWTWLEDVFDEAATAKKSVQLHIVPGNDSPSWLA